MIAARCMAVDKHTVCLVLQAACTLTAAPQAEPLRCNPLCAATLPPSLAGYTHMIAPSALVEVQRDAVLVGTSGFFGLVAMEVSGNVGVQMPQSLQLMPPAEWGSMVFLAWWPWRELCLESVVWDAADVTC